MIEQSARKPPKQRPARTARIVDNSGNVYSANAIPDATNTSVSSTAVNFSRFGDKFRCIVAPAGLDFEALYIFIFIQLKSSLHMRVAELLRWSAVTTIASFFQNGYSGRGGSRHERQQAQLVIDALISRLLSLLVRSMQRWHADAFSYSGRDLSSRFNGWRHPRHRVKVPGSS